MKKKTVLKKSKHYVIVQDVMTYEYYCVKAENQKEAQKEFYKGNYDHYNTIYGDTSNEFMTLTKAYENSYADFEEKDL